MELRTTTDRTPPDSANTRPAATSGEGGGLCGPAHGVGTRRAAHSPTLGPSRPATLRPLDPRPHPPATRPPADRIGRDPHGREPPEPEPTRARPPPAPWGDPVGYCLVCCPVRLGCLEGVVVWVRPLTVVHSVLWVSLDVIHSVTCRGSFRRRGACVVSGWCFSRLRCRSVGLRCALRSSCLRLTSLHGQTAPLPPQVD